MSDDRFAVARAVADAVLYEGYMLYPYRASSTKNQVRWQFGVLAPPDWAVADGSERSACRTELIVVGDAALRTRIRCLQIQRRTVESCRDGEFHPVDGLMVDGSMAVPWDEAVEREIDIVGVQVAETVGTTVDQAFTLPTTVSEEPLRNAVGEVVGRLVRRCDEIHGHVHIRSIAVGGGHRLSVEVRNTTARVEPGVPRDDALTRSLLAVHTLLAVDGGGFVSSFAPPDALRNAVAVCTNEGTFPVLVGPDGTTDVVLSSPIILYDYPAVAPESPGNLFDGTEIDEILALRVLTLTDAEKAEARSTDARAADIIDRCDDMPPEIWDRLHGAIRSMGPLDSETPVDIGGVPTFGDDAPWWDPIADEAVDPWTDTVVVAGLAVTKGVTVRLHPSRRADAHDLFVADHLATVAGVFRDAEGQVHVAVTIDDDPATEMLQLQGRYWFFFPDEVEPVEADAAEFAEPRS